MLKIKDNVDLKELEKFGFIHISDKEMLIPRYKRGRVRIYYDIDKGLDLSIEEINTIRKKYNEPLLYNRAITIEGELLIDDNDNDIFDLIKADLVERVE